MLMEDMLCVHCLRDEEHCTCSMDALADLAIQHFKLAYAIAKRLNEELANDN